MFIFPQRNKVKSDKKKYFNENVGFDQKAIFFISK